MKCDEVVENLDAYNAGELGESERMRVAEHLAACADCEREREELLALATELRSAGASFQALRPFTVPPAPAKPSRRRPWLVAAGVAAAVWLVLLTAAAFWPSFAERLSFLPVGRRLAQSAPLSPTTTASPETNGYALSDAPAAALAAVNALFLPDEGRLPSEEAVSAELSELLPANLARGATSVRVVSVGPVRSVSEGEVRLVVTVDIDRFDEQDAAGPQRYSLLLAVDRSPQDEWQVSDLQVLGD